jgi:endonuclease/exonuclease/phosphatase family metal-dependent hydrolase
MNDKAVTATKTSRLLPGIGWLAGRPLLIELSLLALTVLFGLQLLRVMVPGVVWLLGDRMGMGAIEAGGLAAIIFLAAFLVWPLHRLLGSRMAVVVTAGGLGLLRLVVQILPDEPLVGLILAMVATALFVLFLPLYMRNLRDYGRMTMGHLGVGLLVGLMLDTAIHGAFNTYDISWQAGLLPLLLTLLFVLVQWIILASVALRRDVKSTEKSDTETHGVPKGRSYTWLAIGPFLFLQLVIFQNIARLAVSTGWPLPWAFGWTLLGQLIGLTAAVWVLRWRPLTSWPLALICGLGLVIILALSQVQVEVPAAVLFFVGQVLLSPLIVLVFIGIGMSTPQAGFSSLNVANGLGMLLLLLLLLGYYAVYDMSLPYSNTILEPVAAFIVAACAVGASTGLRQRIKLPRRVWLAPAVTLLLLILPLVGAITWHTPTAVSGEGFPIRIMTYNLHNGFNTEGRLDMEALAQVIEDSDPDIVALQEISRGWVVNGRLDMLTWLSQRLDLPYIFGPTADPFWGNAILSRYPVIEYTQRDLPPRDLFILRGFTVALIDLGNGDSLQVLATHYHHLEEDTNIRQVQSHSIIAFWEGDERTVLMGDLNAEPSHTEMEMLQVAGLVDAMAEVDPPEYTFPSFNPDRRIDYIWVSPDLTVSDVHVPVSTASDHLPVVAEIVR